MLSAHGGGAALAYVAARAAVMRMIDPGAMGRFRVLLLGKDVPRAMLRGFSVRL
ncbi:MAG TPA: hypothetical protein VFI42_05695 [Thermomicrobiaceae bacterium]|nr:hypothetical protein [Thermomicrobiaceae bacterium]